jgi:MFS superfamily sulfate permease-like transporter
MTEPLASSSKASSRIRPLVPGVGLLRSYEAVLLRADVTGGLTLAAYLLPAGIGDASLAGLPTLSDLRDLLR